MPARTIPLLRFSLMIISIPPVGTIGISTRPLFYHGWTPTLDSVATGQAGLGAALPATATAIVTPSPAPAPTPTLTLGPVPTPSVTPTPSPSPAPFPTATASPTPTSIPTPCHCRVAFVAKWSGFNIPSGIAIDADGNLSATDSENHRVQVFGNTGAFLRSSRRRTQALMAGNLSSNVAKPND